MFKRICAVLGGVFFCFLAAPGTAGSVTVGALAPDFTATTLDGKQVTLADFKGQVLLINLWATWCAPCKEELPLLEGYYRVQSKYGLHVVAVSTEYSLPPEKLKPVAEHLTLTMVRDFHGPYRAAGGVVPTNFVIDRDGVVRYAEAGAFTLDKLNQVLVPLLRQPVNSPRAVTNGDKPSASPPGATPGH